MDTTRELIVKAIKQVKAERDAAWKAKPTDGPTAPGGLVTAVKNLERALRWYDEDTQQKKGTK